MQEQELLLLRVGTKTSEYYGYCKDCGKPLKNFYAKKCASCCKVGRPRTEETKKKIGEGHLGEKNSFWKGDNVQYRALHSWVKRNKPKVKNCQRCNEIKKLCIANISGKYKRDVNDFEWLCYSCHNKKDMIELNFHKKLNRNTYTIQKEV